MTTLDLTAIPTNHISDEARSTIAVSGWMNIPVSEFPSPDGGAQNAKAWVADYLKKQGISLEIETVGDIIITQPNDGSESDPVLRPYLIDTYDVTGTLVTPRQIRIIHNDPESSPSPFSLVLHDEQGVPRLFGSFANEEAALSVSSLWTTGMMGIDLSVLPVFEEA